MSNTCTVYIYFVYIDDQQTFRRIYVGSTVTLSLREHKYQINNVIFPISTFYYYQKTRDDVMPNYSSFYKSSSRNFPVISNVFLFFYVLSYIGRNA